MILLINNGPSSVNVAVYSNDSLERIIDIGIEQLSDQATPLHFGSDSISVIAPDHTSALSLILDMLFARSFDPNEICAVAHRLPRLNDNVTHPTLINEQVEALIDSNVSSMPAYSKDCLNNIHFARSELPNCAQVAFFDSDYKTDFDYDDMANAIHSLISSTDIDSSSNRSLNVIPVAVSARHVHLDQDTLHALFGEGNTLTPKQQLSQPGQFLAQETLTIIGPRNQLEKVPVVGPTRAQNQVEISRSDEFYLGLHAPMRASGDTSDTAGIELAGPNGSVVLETRVICARRHIHMHPKDAKRFALNNDDLVSVVVGHGQRQLTFDSVLVRVNDAYKLEMHIDTDDANAAGLITHDPAVLEATNLQARITSISKPT